MAEGGEGGGKASDLYLGVVDLFAVILPGALLSGIVWKTLSHSEDGRKLLEGISAPEFVPKWLVFMIAAYIVGHFLFAIGAWMMDPLYDHYYKHKLEQKKELSSIRRRADRVMWLGLQDTLYWEKDNRLTWAESLLRMGAPAAKANLDRLEADSKFFRSLALVSVLTVAALFSPLTGWVGLLWWVGACVAALAFLMATNKRRKKLLNQTGARVRVKEQLGMPNPPPKDAPKDVEQVSRFAWPDDQWVAKEKEITEADAERFRWFVRLFPRAWGLLVVFLMLVAWKNHHPLAWLAGPLCYILTLASAHRYMEIRAKRLVQAYFSVIALHKSSVFNPPPVEKK